MRPWRSPVVLTGTLCSIRLPILTMVETRSRILQSSPTDSDDVEKCT